MGQQNVLQRQHGVLGEELYVLGLRNPDSGRHQFQTRRAGRQVPNQVAFGGVLESFFPSQLGGLVKIVDKQPQQNNIT